MTDCLKHNGKKVCVGRRGGCYKHTKKGGKKYLTKAEKKKVRKGGRIVSKKELTRIGKSRTGTSNAGRNKGMFDKMMKLSFTKK